MIAVDIAPRGPFHVGELGVGREGTLSYVPSDTLYAAFVEAWVAGGQRGPFDDPPLRITSAFPRLGSVRLYPRPLVRLKVAQARRDDLGKQLIKFKWCSERIFRMLLGGAEMTELATRENLSAGLWLHPDERGTLPKLPEGGVYWANDFAPHVAIDRATNAPNLYHSGRVSFAPGCGLWFGVEHLTADAPARLERALHYLADAGLGGMRSTGHGGFHFTTGQTAASADGPSPQGYAVTLARYLPGSVDEVAKTLQAEHAAYRLEIVGGWCQGDSGRPWRRRQVRLVREGSVIGWANGVPGRVADVKPDDVSDFQHRSVLRYGIAFPMPVAEEALL